MSILLEAKKGGSMLLLPELSKSSFEEMIQHVRYLRANPDGSPLSKQLKATKQMEDSLFDYFQNELDIKNMSRIRDAIDIMYFCERGNMRKDNVSFAAEHQLEVMRIIAEKGLPDELIYIIAALHDTPENTRSKPLNKFGSVTNKSLGRFFDHKSITDAVEALSNVKTANDAVRNDLTQFKIIDSLLTDPRVVIVKLADRLHNMRTIKALKPSRQKVKAQETLDLYVGLARKLGLHNWADELETRSLSVLYGASQMGEIEKRYLAIYTDAAINMLSETFSINNPMFHDIPVFDPSIRLATLHLHKRLNQDALGNLNVQNDQYYAETDLIIPSSAMGFTAMAAMILDRLHKIELPFELRIPDSEMKIPYNKQEIEVVLNGRDGVHLLVRIISENAFAQKNASIVNLYQLDSDSKTMNFAQAKLESLQRNVARLKDSTVINRADAVREFVKDLDTELITVYSPIGEVYTFAENAIYLDYAYAAGEDIGNKAEGGVKIFINGIPRQTPLSIFDVMTLGAVIHLQQAENEIDVDYEFIERLDTVKTEEARKQISHRIRRKMRLELNRFNSNGQINDEEFDQRAVTEAPITFKIRSRGIDIIRNTFKSLAQTQHIWPEELIVRPSASSFFKDNGGNFVPSRYHEFIEDIGLKSIVPGGRRQDYFNSVLKDLLRRQRNLIRISIHAPDLPGISALINEQFAKLDLNIVYEQSEVHPHILSDSMVIRVVEGNELPVIMDKLLPILTNIKDPHTERPILIVDNISRCSGNPILLAHPN